MTDDLAADEIEELRAAMKWQPIESAPRDGTVIDLTWMENGKPQEIWPMMWGHIQRNALFAPGVIGMWVMPGGGATWNESDPEGAPTHWRPHIPPPPTQEEEG